RALLHPGLSYDADGTVRELVFFPITVARVAARQGARLVIVPQWALEQSFTRAGALDAAYYRRFSNPEDWAVVPRWSTQYCRLTEQRKIPFITTHDLADHIAGFQGSAWETLIPAARRVRACLDGLFAECPSPPVQALVLPF